MRRVASSKRRCCDAGSDSEFLGCVTRIAGLEGVTEVSWGPTLNVFSGTQQPTPASFVPSSVPGIVMNSILPVTATETPTDALSNASPSSVPSSFIPSSVAASMSPSHFLASSSAGPTPSASKYRTIYSIFLQLTVPSSFVGLDESSHDRLRMMVESEVARLCLLHNQGSDGKVDEVTFYPYMLDVKLANNKFVVEFEADLVWYPRAEIPSLVPLDDVLRSGNDDEFLASIVSAVPGLAGSTDLVWLPTVEDPHLQPTRNLLRTQAMRRQCTFGFNCVGCPELGWKHKFELACGVC